MFCKRFQLYVDFKLHVESHVGCFICIVCGYNFNDASELFMHEETHRKIDDELRHYVCDSCGHKLATKAQLQVHMRKHVGDFEYVWFVQNDIKLFFHLLIIFSINSVTFVENLINTLHHFFTTNWYIRIHLIILVVIVIRNLE